MPWGFMVIRGGTSGDDLTKSSHFLDQLDNYPVQQGVPLQGTLLDNSQTAFG